MHPSLDSGRRLAAPLAMALGLVLACQDAPTPPHTTIPISASLQATAADEVPDQLAVAQAVPGFGGYYINENGAPTVWLTDPSRRAQAAAALAGFLESFGWTEADLVVRQAQYDWIQLDAWYREAWPRVLTLQGAVSTDMDEGKNRLRFTGLDASVLTNITSTLTSLGIPREAAVIELRGPVQQLLALTSKVRPPYGGYQIQFFATPASPLVFVCTLGFNVVWSGINSFITNSHCSNVQGGITVRTDYYQATRGGAIPNPDNFIAFEVQDPEYTAEPCPLGRRCRYSDAARAQYGAGQSFLLGRIARTTLRNDALAANDPTYLQVDSLNPAYRLVSEQATPILGQSLSHVGRTTGWTQGPVTATCENINITASEITQLCQGLVAAFVAGGDSGSPTFGFHTNGTVFLAGILWGSSTDLETGEVQFIFSPTANIHSEIGAFTGTDPIKGKKPKKAKP
ncbi:MAG: hypothetical protein ACT4PM_08745 [Gemmatimonadales bacterium]